MTMRQMKREASYETSDDPSASSEDVTHQPSTSAVDVDDSHQQSPADVSHAWPVYQPPIPSFEELLWSLSKLALDSYNSTHQLKFQLEHALHMEEILISGSSYSLYCHLSFIARTQDSSTKLKLFFAEVVNEAVVKICTPVEPGNPLFPLGCGRCHPEGVIYHPFEKYDVGGRRYLQSPRPPKLTEAEESAKKLLNETYILKYTVELLSPEEESELREKTYGYAMRALDWYEHNKRCSYKLLKPLASVRFHVDEIVSALLDCSHYVHLNFEATSNDLPDASPETFFAEFNLDYGYVTTCINLTEAISSSLNNKVESSCPVCRGHFPMYHPMGEYKGFKYQAGHRGGTFAYAQDEYRTWVAKVELQKKVEL